MERGILILLLVLPTVSTITTSSLISDLLVRGDSFLGDEETRTESNEDELFLRTFFDSSNITVNVSASDDAFDVSDITEYTIQQPLDHFHPADTRTFEQHYFHSPKYGGPNNNNVNFLAIGGEFGVSKRFLNYSTAMISYAKEFGGDLYLLEHRYYGNSTFEGAHKNLQYLHSRQAIQDIKKFIDYIRELKEKAGESEPQKWILVGGSYPGSLALWFRAMYPDYVVGAIGSSAPLEATTSFYGYLKVVEDVVRRHDTRDKSCSEEVDKAFTKVQSRMLSHQGREELENIFQLGLLNTPKISAHNISMFYLFLQTRFYFATQLGPMKGNNSLAAICDIMTDKKQGLLHRIKETMYRTMANGTRIYIRDDRDAVLDATSGRLWRWQMCNEFGFFITPEHTDIFHSTVSSESYYETCRLEFNKTADDIERGVRETNEYYGGIDKYKGTNVVITHGDRDPWKWLGKKHSDDLSILIYTIKDATHCNDLQLKEEANIQQVQKLTRYHIKRWLNMQQAETAENATTANTTERPSSSTGSPASSSPSTAQQGVYDSQVTFVPVTPQTPSTPAVLVHTSTTAPTRTIATTTTSAIENSSSANVTSSSSTTTTTTTTTTTRTPRSTAFTPTTQVAASTTIIVAAEPVATTTHPTTIVSKNIHTFKPRNATTTSTATVHQTRPQSYPIQPETGPTPVTDQESRLNATEMENDTSDKRKIEKHADIMQPLDHFNSTDGRRFRQRFYFNDHFATIHGPNFLVIGGEERANGNTIYSRNSANVHYANQTGAMLYLLEHRYYGDSQTGTSNLRFLDNWQALFDIEKFIKEQSAKSPSRGPWIVFGGDHAGSLAAWTREWFPELVTGAVASSAPLDTKYDYYGYYKSIEGSLRTLGGEACVNATKKAFDELRNRTVTIEGRKKLSQLFRLKQEAASVSDVHLVTATLVYNIGYFAQYPRYDGKAFCRNMTESNDKSYLERLVRVNNLVFPDSIVYRNNTNNSTHMGGPDSIYTWQMCRDLRRLQPQNQTGSGLGDSNARHYWISRCQNGTNTTAQQHSPEEVQHSGKRGYWGTNVVFTNGALDAHAVKIIKEEIADDSVVAITIEGAKQGDDLTIDTINKYVIEAQAAILNNIRKWIGQNNLSLNKAVKSH